jgi:hypothetical protein
MFTESVLGLIYILNIGLQLIELNLELVVTFEPDRQLSHKIKKRLQTLLALPQVILDTPVGFSSAAGSISSSVKFFAMTFLRKSLHMCHISRFLSDVLFPELVRPSLHLKEHRRF